MNTNDHGFEQRAGELLRESAANLDGATRARLARARATALSEARRPAWLDWRYLAPAGATASAALVALLLVGRGSPPTPVNDATTGALYDLELLADADGFELSQETDLDFIEWAAAMSEADEAGG